jgi:predicted GIY-YIG superfamily endonuclease
MGTHRTFIATYIMASGRNGTTYVGMTSNLHARVWKHKNGTYGATPPNTVAPNSSGTSSING